MKTISANGAEIPVLGFGTWTLDDVEAEQMVAEALEAGYRHIDTAAMYGNETGVGRALSTAGGERDKLFITTKVWHDQLNDGALQASVEQSLNKLSVDYVDLILVHWPSAETPLEETIGALNDVHQRGLAKHIGVANFTASLIEQATRLSDSPLACNQIEYHAMLPQDTVMAACAAHDIAITAYCPLAQGRSLMDHPAITTPADRLGVTPGQIALNWLVRQDNVAAIPRTHRPERLAQNLDVFDLDLTQQERDTIDQLQSKRLRVVNPDFAPEWDL